MTHRLLSSMQRAVTVCGLGAALLALGACRPPKSIDFYRENALARDSMVNHCLATNSTSTDCYNAITAEAERWGTKDIDGFTVMISGDGEAAQAINGPTLPAHPVLGDSVPVAPAAPAK